MSIEISTGKFVISRFQLHFPQINFPCIHYT